MRLETTQRMGLDMRLAPHMIQSMEILQLPLLELEQRLREEAETNPALELGESRLETNSTDFESMYQVEESGVGAAVDGQLLPDGPPSREEAREERIATERDEFEKIYEEYSDTYIPDHQPSRVAGLELSDKKQDAMLNMADRPPALSDHLLEQLVLQDTTKAVRRFAEHIITNLSEKGWLSTSLEALRASYEAEHGTAVSVAEAEDALAVIQQLDPAGVGARDLAECLLIQLDDPNPEIEHVETLRTLIRDHWDDLYHNRLPAVEKKSGISIARIQEARSELRLLDPNPAANFSAGETQYVVPELAVEKDDKGDYHIRMNDQYLPDVQISTQYMEVIKQKHGDKQAKEYLKRKIDHARHLLEAIEQRRKTLEKVTRAIIEHQREFLENGPDFIEPLKMQQIADRVGVHVTTVSRAVDDKWILTPRGTFPLKRFFGGGTVTHDGKEVAFETIKRRLSDVIAAEDKGSPLSDDDLVEKLQEMGYPLARRTVTKYRKLLSIPSSRERKQHV